MEEQGNRHTLKRCQSLPNTSGRRKMALSTRMKKAAPSPPGASTSKQPPLTNGDVLRRLETEATPHRPPMSCTPGEDCAFDELLEGRMDLEVVLPDRRTVRITVDRRTPMMDLLVHVATSNKLSAGNHTIKVLSEEQHNILYKPNTPIGSLDVNTVYIVPKSSVEVPVKRMPKLANQPFEQTFRLQVNLPRNQRMVLRVSPRITLAELKRQICNEKELDHSNHHLVHPAQPDTVLDLNSTLDVYGCAEISLLSNSGLRDSIHSLSTQLIAYPRVLDEEKKRKGILRLFSKKKKETPVENSSNGIGSQSISTSVRSESLTRDGYQPKQSTKRKPAPAPPSSSPPLVIQSSSSINSRPESEISAKTDELGSTVSHSRHSSDSSGYHEPSVFSDCSENKSPEASIVHGGNVLSGPDSTFCKDIPDCLNLTKPTTLAKDLSNLKTVPSCSNTSIVSANRKRKAPQPPGPALPEVETPSPEDQNPSFELSVQRLPITEDSEESTANQGGELERDTRARESNAVEKPEEDANKCFTVSQQESEALEYFENVLHESEAVDDVESSCTSRDTKSEMVEDQVIVESVPETPSAVINSARCMSDERGETNCSATASVPSLDSAVSSSTSDASEIPPVPLNKDILLKEASVTQFSDSESAFTECLAQKTADECIEHVIETPPVPNEDQCPSIQKLSDCAGIFKPKEVVSVDGVDRAVSPVENQKLKETLEDAKGEELPTETRLAENEVVTTPSTQKKLINFAMGCYKSEVRDIYEAESQPSLSAVPSREVDSMKKNECLLRHEFQAEVEVHAEQTLRRQAPNVRIVPFEDRRIQAQEDVLVNGSNRGQVQQRCTELSNISTLPLTGRSASLYNLSPQKKTVQHKPVTDRTNLEPVTSFLKRTLSDQNVSQDTAIEEEKSEFIEEQKRLHEEYLKLQVQFISWQKQLLNNQTLLQSEQIVPQMSFPALEQYKIELEKLPVGLQDTVYPEQEAEEDFKTRSLPRAKSRPLTIKQQNRSETPPAISRNCKSEEIIEPNPPLKQEKAVMSDSGISTEETSDHSNVPSETIEETPELGQASKCQTLPRLVNRPISALETAKTMTLNRQPRPKSQVVSVTIGSWQQRNATAPDINSASVASSRSMFQSLENLPREHTKVSAPVPVQRKKTKVLAAARNEDKTDTSKTTTEVKEVVATAEDTRRSTEATVAQNNVGKKTPEQAEKPVFKKPESVKPRTKTDHKIPAAESHKKSTKPFVRLSSMKDEIHPPPALHVLKKWPLPEIVEKKDPKKPVEHSFWDEITASAKRPTGRSREKVTHAEVDLRRHRSAKSDPSSNTTRNKYPDETASKIHVTKVNISDADKDINKIPSVDQMKSKPVRSSSATPLSSALLSNQSEPFSTELKNVLSKRASTLAESEEPQTNSAEPTYAEAKNGHEVRKRQMIPAQNNSPPPPPPPPVSTMPAIPPAAPIPKSSQLLMEKRGKSSTLKKQSSSQPKTTPAMAPREELMLEIRGFGGRQALRKVPATQPGWHLKVYGSASAVNS